MGKPITLNEALVKPVEEYRNKHNYNTITQAANHLIRSGLEIEEKRTQWLSQTS